MTFEVVFTDEASFQVLQIQDWIAERSITGAQPTVTPFIPIPAVRTATPFEDRYQRLSLPYKTGRRIQRREQ